MLRNLCVAGAIACLILLPRMAHGSPLLDPDTSAAPQEENDFIVQPLAICGVDDRQSAACYDGSLWPSEAMVAQARLPAIMFEVPLISDPSLIIACSGGLIYNDLVITAEHCISNPDANMALALVRFNHTIDCDGVVDSGSVYWVTDVVEQHFSLGSSDLAILRIATPDEPRNTFGTYPISHHDPVSNMDVMMVAHPDARPQELAAGTGGPGLAGGVWYDLDTEGGSSGGAVLDMYGRLVAVHHGGSCTLGGNSGTSVKEMAESGTSPTLAQLSDGHELFPSHSGDVTGDGLDDLVTVYSDAITQRVAIRTEISTGDGTWTSVLAREPEGEEILQGGRHLADFNGDGRRDLLFVYQMNGRLNIRTKISDADGSWTTFTTSFPESVDPSSAAFFSGDVNGDGRADLMYRIGSTIYTKIAIWNAYYETLSWSSRTGSIALPAGMPLATYPALSGDVNGDGRADLVLMGRYSKLGLIVTTALGVDGSSWNCSSTRLAEYGTEIHEYPALLGDFDRNFRRYTLFGIIDYSSPGDELTFVYQPTSSYLRLLTMYFDETNMQWYLRKDASVYVGSDGEAIHQYPTMVADFDGDGDEDLAFVHQDGGLRIRTVLPGFYSSDFGYATTSASFGDGTQVHANPTLVGDVTGDGGKDLLFAFRHYLDATYVLRVRDYYSGTWALLEDRP